MAVRGFEYHRLLLDRLRYQHAVLRSVRMWTSLLLAMFLALAKLSTHACTRVERRLRCCCYQSTGGVCSLYGSPLFAGERGHSVNQFQFGRHVLDGVRLSPLVTVAIEVACTLWHSKSQPATELPATVSDSSPSEQNNACFSSGCLVGTSLLCVMGCVVCVSVFCVVLLWVGVLVPCVL